jgi:SAF domain
VRAGQLIQRQDLVSVQIGTGSAVRAIPVERAGDVVGRRSLVRLLPGSLVNPDAVVDKLVPAQGQALVGLSLSPGQRPAVRMDAGDRVEIVHTPGSQESPSAGATTTPPVFAVVVSTVDDPDTGKTVVNVSVPEAAAATVATWGSAGRATLAVLPAEQA